MITNEKFMLGLQKTANRLQKIAEEWDELDRELQSEYYEQVEWMFDRAMTMGAPVELIAPLSHFLNAALR